MATLTVDAMARTLCAFGRTMPCLIGRNGACSAEDKREGDGRTPLGRWPIRAVLLRQDRIGLAGVPSIPWRWLRPTDGWSDDESDPEYNRPVSHSHALGAERLWREDEAYDVIVVLGHNDNPPQAGRGSAVFLHLVANSPFTEGCIAIPQPEMSWLIPQLRTDDVVEVRMMDLGELRP